MATISWCKTASEPSVRRSSTNMECPLRRCRPTKRATWRLQSETEVRAMCHRSKYSEQRISCSPLSPRAPDPRATQSLTISVDPAAIGYLDEERPAAVAGWARRRALSGSILSSFFRTLVPSMESSKVALAFCSLLFALPGFAQVALKSDTPSLLFWTPDQQSTGYRSIEKIYKV